MTTAEQMDLMATLADMPDEAVRRIVAQAEAERDLQFEFEKFHQANPGVYRALVDLARRAKAAGHEHIGIGMLWEVLRWETLVGDTAATDGYKLNNNHRSRYARLDHGTGTGPRRVVRDKEAAVVKQKLGDKARDTVTGFEGIVTSRTDYLNGCVRYCLEAPDPANNAVTEMHFDEERLERVGKGWQAPAEKRAATGGARPAPPRTGTR